jgi:hypothetical protein
MDVLGANDVPGGVCDTVPDPTTTTLKFMLVTKFAVAVVFAFRINVQVGWKFCGHTPPQLTKDEFALGVAVKVIVVLLASEVPVGLWVTVPGPLAVTAIENLVTVVAPVPLSSEPTKFPLGPLTFTVAARPPTTCGVKVMVMEHDDPAGIGADMQVFVCEKSPGFEPPMVTDDTTSDAVAFAPFCSWMVKGEEEPVAVSGNRIGVGATRIGSAVGGGAATDVADIESVRVEALVSMVSVPVKVPAAVGAKFTIAEQFPPDATGDAQLLVTERLGSPVTAMLVIASGP